MTKIVLNGLIEKRAEIERDLTIARDRLAMLEIDLANIEGAIRVFDPDIVVPERSKRVPAVHAAPVGHMSRFITDCLRNASRPVSSGEIVDYVMEQRKLDPRDRRLRRNMSDRTGQVLRTMRKRGLITSEKTAEGVLVWSVAT